MTNLANTARLMIVPPLRRNPIPTAGARNDLTALSPPAAISDDEQGSSLRSLFKAGAFHQHYQPDSTILLHGEKTDAIYLIVSGTVRCCTISEDGKRQIFRFAQKGEFVGMSDMETWHFTAEAVDHVILQSVPRTALERQLATNIPLRQDLRAHMCRQLECREKQLLLLVTSKAPERLFQFLRDFAAPRAGAGYIALPMCRRDIADHLGMSVETVSRAFGDLKARGLIDMACAEKYQICAKDGQRQREPRYA